MNWFVSSLKLQLRQLLCRRMLILFVTLALALTVWAVALPREQTALTQVGVVLPQQGGEGIYELLQRRNSGLIEFTITDEADMERQILRGNFDCGLILAEDFSRKLERLDTDELFILVTGPGSAVYPLVRETVAACMVELCSPGVAEKFLRQAGVDTANLADTLQRLREEAPRVQLRAKTLNGNPMDALSLADAGGRQMLAGLLGMLTMGWGLYMAADLGNWLRSPWGRRLRSVQPVNLVLLPRLVAAWLPMLSWGMVFLLLLGKGVPALVSFILLIAVMAALALVIARLPNLWRAVPVVVPFLMAACLVTEPVLLDTAALFPLVGKLTSLLPVTLYIRGSQGSWMALVLLAMEFAALCLATVVPYKEK